MSLRKTFEIFFLTTLVAGIFYVWRSVPLPCAAPLEYSLGTFDTHFNISQETFLKDIALAEKPWEEAFGRELFRYNPQGGLPINLIYDERQARTLETQKLEEAKGQLEKSQISLQTRSKKLFESYNERLQSYNGALISFEKRLAQFNTDVKYWNERGGAPKDEYDRLQKEEKKLKSLQKDLQMESESLNTLASQINISSKQAVQSANAFNDQVNDFLERHAGEPEDFDQGDYNGTAIDIYQFDDEAHLRTVLAHELGHALGLGHVENPRSIMYHFMEAQDTTQLTLTSEDKVELQKICQKSRSDIFREKIALLKMRLGML